MSPASSPKPLPACASSRPGSKSGGHLSGAWRKHRCTEDYAGNLSKRIMRPAIAELDEHFGAAWARNVDPWLVREGSALTDKFTVRRLPG